MNVFIYALIDPRDNDIRYVGMSKDPIYRLKQHFWKSQINKSTYKNHWLKNLLSNNLYPILEIIEECPEMIWQGRERFWIKYYSYLGCRLTNSTSGGEGLPNLSAESRAKISQKLTGKKLTPEHIKNLSLSHIGKKQTFEHTENIRLGNLGKKKSNNNYPGVTFDRGRWRAYIVYKQKQHYLGRFLIETDAHVAYQNALELVRSNKFHAK